MSVDVKSGINLFDEIAEYTAAPEKTLEARAYVADLVGPVARVYLPTFRSHTVVELEGDGPDLVVSYVDDHVVKKLKIPITVINHFDPVTAAQQHKAQVDHESEMRKLDNQRREIRHLADKYKLQVIIGGENHQYMDEREIACVVAALEYLGSQLWDGKVPEEVINIATGHNSFAMLADNEIDVLRRRLKGE